VSYLISSYALRRAGIVITPHQFRHLAAKNMLDANPGNFPGVKDLLGHKSVRSTMIYAGINSRRAARHHQSLIDETVAAQMPVRKRRYKKGNKNDSAKHGRASIGMANLRRIGLSRRIT